MSTAVAPSRHDLFFSDLCAADHHALLLDYDGTIAPFAADRTRAFPYPTIPELLDGIMSTCGTRVVLISGRAAREIPPLLGLNPHPEIWGSHGLERLHPNGTYELADVSEPAVLALSEAEVSLETQGLRQLCEKKPGAIAVHWRGLGRRQMEEVRSTAYRALSPLQRRAGTVIAEFDGGIEMRVRTRSKADAVHAILAESSPGTPVAYLGDDVSDEDAFRALNGIGLTVLVRPIYRFTAAQLWLRPPAELVQFLTDWVRACRGDL